MAEITIDISSSLHARGFKADERIHSKAFKRVKDLIASQLEKAQNYNGDYLASDSYSDFVRYYNGISVLGERGVGKTSFLLSLRKEYLEPRHIDGANQENAQNEAKKVILLPLIDPTLFEEKGHLFLLIVTLIDNLVHKAVENEPEGDKKAAYERYQDVKQLLAQGLPTLDNDGMTYTEPQWHEDEYMMVRGMESVKAAFDLERNFHRLVNEALKVIGGKAFMLMFDDIDVDFKKGWMVLETLRKFLTTPQLIILLSGNMKLYSKNVRKQQWRNFGKELLKNEMESGEAGKAEYARLVNEIEGQYMQKVLKSENRVFLYSMNENILINGDEFKVKYDEGESVPLQQAYQKILEENGVMGSAIVSIFSSFLMSTSMRTQVHFLYNMHHLAKNDLMTKISAFSSRMYAQNIDVDLMANPKQYNLSLLHYLINHELLEEAYQLIPNFESTDVNSALMGFTFVFSQLVKKSPALIFDYWCRICMTRNNMHYLSYDKESKDYVGKYCVGARIFQSRDLRSLVGNSMAFLASLQQGITQHEGAVPLLGFGDVAKGSGRDLDKRIDKVLAQVTDLQRALGYMPLVTLLYDDRNGRSLHYSIYSLLANIGQIIKATDDAMLRQAIRTACMPLNYQVRTNEEYSTTDAQDIIPEAEIMIEDATVTTLVESIKRWKEHYATLSIGYGNYLFGRIATRIYYSLVNIAENNKTKSLGKVFGLFVADILNACLIAESRVCKDERLGAININNVSTSGKILADNIGKLNGVTLPFTKWMAACPLLYPYINLTEFPVVTDFIKESCNQQVLADALFTQEGCMVTILDKIACLYQKGKPKFSYAKGKILNTIRIINENHLDIRLIMEDEVKDAKTHLEKIFDNVYPKSIAQLRSLCRNNNGILELNPA